MAGEKEEDEMSVEFIWREVPKEYTEAPSSEAAFNAITASILIRGWQDFYGVQEAESPCEPDAPAYSEAKE